MLPVVGLRSLRRCLGRPRRRLCSGLDLAMSLDGGLAEVVESFFALAESDHKKYEATKRMKSNGNTIAGASSSLLIHFPAQHLPAIPSWVLAGDESCDSFMPHQT